MVAHHRTKVYVGMGGWEFGILNNIFYPPKPKKGFRRLEFYAQFFDSVEINATFYNIDFTPEHARQWLHDVSVNENFVFTLKVFKGFTHDFRATNNEVRAIHRLLEPLAGAGRLGGILLQFPYSFINSAEQRKYILQFGRVFYPYRVFVELRHDSWNTATVFTLLRENRLHLVNVDLPRIRQHMPFTDEVWDGVAYIRLLGRNGKGRGNPPLQDRDKYSYSEQELEDLSVRIDRIRSRAETVFVVFHNDADSALVNGFQLRHRIEQKAPVPVPQDFADAFPMLRNIVRPVDVLHPLFAQV